MKKTIIPLLILLLFCVFVLAAGAQDKKPGMRKVCLYNQATKEIKVGCTEIMGKFDSQPIYKCYDPKKKRPVSFDIGKDWKVVSSSPVCMKNPVTAVVKPDCIKCELSKGDEGQYFYFDKESGKAHELGKPWEPLPIDDPMCKPTKFPSNGLIKSVDPIRQFEFETGADPEESSKEEQKP